MKHLEQQLVLHLEQELVKHLEMMIQYLHENIPECWECNTTRQARLDVTLLRVRPRYDRLQMALS